MVRFHKWVCNTKLGKYSNGNTAFELWDKEGPIATCTVNLGQKLPPDQAYIKDYSENEGMMLSLVNAGIVLYMINLMPSGFVTVPLCQLDLDVLKEMKMKEEEEV
jgi:hypothetical protein